MSADRRIELAGPEATETLGRSLALGLPRGGLAVALGGPLGAGKSTLARALLRAMGVAGAIPSPTYTLVEPYEAGGRHLYHVDLYRLGSADEVDYLGLADIEPGAVLLVEWPERGGSALAFDLVIELVHASPGRVARLTALTPAGRTAIEAMTEATA